MASSSLRDELNCSICLNIFTDPVMLRCGHNFCRVCINCALDTQQGLGVYSCPDCRTEFTERPALQRNITLCNIMRCFPSTQPDEKETGVSCSYCVDSPVPAVKSCLLCEASLCYKHLGVHSKAPEHILTDPTTSMEDKKCLVHRKILEYYCIQDAVCICVSCSLVGDHVGHKVELLDEASEKKKKKLKGVLDNLTSDREETENRVLRLQDHGKKVQEKAGVLIQRFTALVGEFREKLNTLEKTIPIMISTEEKRLSLSVTGLIQQLEIKNDELSRKICLTEELCSKSDPITVLKDQLCVSDHTEDEILKVVVDDVHKVGDLDMTFISALLHTCIDNCATEADSSGFNFPQISDISLDVNTAGNDVAISEDLKMASWHGMGQKYYQTPVRFQSCQVLSLASFSTGKHYWEMEWSEQGNCCVGVSYSSIERQGGQCIIGENDKSWGLRIWENHYSAIHNTSVMALPVLVSYRKLGLCLDYEAGKLSFYELGVHMRHLHTFTSTFTEPLHVLCWVLGSWIRFSSRNRKD